MSLLTLFNYPEELTFDTRDTRVVGSSTSVRTQDLKLSGGLLAVANYDMRISGQVGPLGYVGPLGTASSSTSSTSLALTSSFVNAGRHVILIIAHSSGGNVTGASDPRGNT